MTADHNVAEAAESFRCIGDRIESRWRQSSYCER